MRTAIETAFGDTKVPETIPAVNVRERKRAFYRELADLLERYDDVAPCDGNLTLDGGQWQVKGGIIKGGDR